MARNGKRLQAGYEAIDRDRDYDLEDAIRALKDVKVAKFDETVEIALNLNVDPRHADQMVRGVVSLPHGTGRAITVAVFARGAKADEAREAGADKVGAEDLAETIQAGQLGFDRCIATPDMMPVVGRLGKILGAPRPDAKPEARYRDHGCRRRRRGGQGRPGGNTASRGRASFTPVSESSRFRSKRSPRTRARWWTQWRSRSRRP